jgi:hypothetical protein
MRTACLLLAGALATSSVADAAETFRFPPMVVCNDQDGCAVRRSIPPEDPVIAQYEQAQKILETCAPQEDGTWLCVGGLPKHELPKVPKKP